MGYDKKLPDILNKSNDSAFLKFALIGEKLSHSHSKTIHEKLGLYEYDLLPTAPENLQKTLQNPEYGGFNVTIPYKKDVMRYCDTLSPEAKSVGCVNTIIREKNGALAGYNTDLPAFLDMLRRSGISLSGKKCAILGSGGTSLTAAAACKISGADEIIKISRNKPGKNNFSADSSVSYITYADTDKYSDAEILINTTPVGMYPGPLVSPVDLSLFTRLTAVVDVIYNPLRTKLLQDAMARGIPAVSGLYMLVRQAVLAAEIFSENIRTDAGNNLNPGFFDGAAERIYAELLSSLENIALIGMPGSGKTTVGELLRSLTGRELFDTDALIESRAGMTIPEIFAAYGEAYFRGLESGIISEIAAKSGVIISTGGGAPLREENRAALRGGSRVFLIERAGELPGENRPLSTDAEAIKKLAAERAPIYALCADEIVENNAEPIDAANAILSLFSMKNFQK